MQQSQMVTGDSRAPSPLKKKLCLYLCFRYESSVAVTRQVFPLRVKCCRYEASVSVTRQVLPLRGKCCRYEASVAVTRQVLPLQGKCCCYEASVATTMQVLPLRGDFKIKLTTFISLTMIVDFTF